MEGRGILLAKAIAWVYNLEETVSSIHSGGFRLQVFPDDHRPPHVHVFSPSGQVICLLHKADRCVTVDEIRGKVASSAVRKALDEVARHFDALVEMWEYYHGSCD
jgi:hypothetical protein